MSNASYLFRGVVYRPDDAAFASFLNNAHNEPDRPVCQCRTPGLEMYVAKVGTQHYIKRMPNTGGLHHPECDSYEPPPELSGLGEVAGSAIQTNTKDGITTLKFDFALSKGAGRAAPATTGAEKSTVKSDGKKLTLRGALHYLIDQAGLSRWSPAMAGKRNWYIFRKYLLEAAADKAVKGNALGNNLFVPESFSLERKSEINQRRNELFAQLKVSERSARKLMILVAEVKEFAPARFGKKLIVKHMPDSFFMLDDALYKRLDKRFHAEMALWSAHEGSHLMIAATFGVGPEGIAGLEEASLVLTNENWIPYETTDEKELLNALNGRRYVKGLRYNLPSTKPLASVVLADTEPPTALYIIPSDVDEAFTEELETLQQESNVASWNWAPANEPMPPLPAPRSSAA
ncbi:hypothetical protein DBB29_00700 [Pandoraea cepalis]|uniref:DUF1173 domain-containing protein n=1 Tax=Pandoraea cepalis TaxID=2508294 RepID=A0AAW7MH62_9BURK|nr:DUF1173 domain-containing protein [Pandoraea cepalis]MDN4572001.1 hypothetical protein [Pandoraea cepalis]MDN4576652.1 hypothetical protein [Pandoraea cepalis]